MTSHQLIQVLSSLHGSPFSELSTTSVEVNPLASERQPFEPQLLTTISPANLSSNVSELISTCLNLIEMNKDIFFTTDGSWRERRDRFNMRESISDKFSVVRDRVALLSAAEMDIFLESLLAKLLITTAECLDAIPSIEDFHNCTDDLLFIQHISELVEKPVRAISMTRNLACMGNSDSSLTKIVVENLEHDLLDHITHARTVLSVWSDDISSLRRNDMNYILERCIPFSSLVAKATLEISISQVPLVLDTLKTPITLACTILAERFRYGLQINGEEIIRVKPTGLDGKNGNSISLQISDTPEILVNSASIGLVIYNLIKNSIKHGALNTVTANTKTTPSQINIEVSPSSDHGCISILVRDNGIGISYDQLRDYFSARALEKLSNKLPLLKTEGFLLNQFWSKHVPPVALQKLLMDRGSSLGNGTGIGLALAQEIIMDKHQGLIDVCRHPEGGACVQILLPNTAENLSAEERRKITLASLIHQLEVSL
jgi:signal transduction histidine kinase